MSDEQHPLTAQIIAACGDAAAAITRLGDEATRENTAGLIRAEAERIRAGAATLVVVGEKKRGKTSLINALVGHAGLLPVDIDVATSVHVEVRYAAEPYALAFIEGVPEPRSIDLAEIAEYAAMDPQTQLPRREDVSYLRVGVPSPLLAQGLALVDTPGVGGLVSGHARLTLAALDLADALVFVVNGSSELTKSELGFLVQATERITTVYFVLTAIDKYDAWQLILERNQSLISEHAPRYRDCPWFAVSSRARLDADAAAAAGDAELARIRHEESGLAELTSKLSDDTARHSEQLRAGNALHVARMAVGPLLASRERHLRSLALDEDLADEMSAREAAVSRLQDQDASWRVTLTTLIQELENDLEIEFQRGVNDLKALGEEKISTAGADGLAEMGGDLEAGIRAAWMRLVNQADAGIARITAELGREFGMSGIGDIAAQLELPDRVRQLPVMVGQTGDDTGLSGAFERMVVATGSGMAVYSALSLLTGGLLTPVIAGIGVTITLIGRRKRREELQRRRGDADRYLQRVINDLYTEGPSKIQQSMTRIRKQIEETVTGLLGQERARVQTEAYEYYQHLQAAEQELAEQRELVSVDIEVLAPIAGRLAELQDRLGQQ
jgi:hypothetical protein